MTYKQLKEIYDHRMATEPNLTQKKIAQDWGITQQSLQHYLANARTRRLQEKLVAEYVSKEIEQK